MPSRPPGQTSIHASPLRLVPSDAVAPDDAPLPASVSGQEMSVLTGVGRERLRTWERRHHFPEPLRQRNGVRRYRADDVAVVATVQRLVQEGVPVPEAIATARESAEQRTTRSLGLLDELPLPAVGLCLGKPIQVEWLNRAAIDAGAAPLVPGTDRDAETFLGERAAEQVRGLLIADEDAVAVISHGDPVAGLTAPDVRSLAWRATTEDTAAAPMVVLVQLPDSADVAPSASVVHDQQRQTTTYATAVGQARRAMRSTTGLLGIQHALRELIVGLGAVDGFFVVRSHGVLRTATSVRDSIRARSVPVAGSPDLIAALDDIAVDWLSPASVRAFKLNPNVAALVVPLNDGELSDAAIVLTFRTEFAIGDVARELLLGFGVVAAASIHDPMLHH